MAQARRPAWAQKVLASIEESRYGLGWSFALMAAACLFRAFLEGAWENTRQIGFGLEPLQSQLMVFIHLPAFFFSLFLLIILGLHAVTGEGIAKITRALAVGSPIILLPVVADRIFGGGYQLYYLNELKDIPEYLFYTFVPWHRLPGASPGIRMEVALGCLAGAWYCRHKTRSWWKALSGFILVFLSCLVAGSLPILFARLWSVLSGTPSSLAQVFSPGGLILTDTRKYAALFLLLFSILAVIWLRRHRPHLLATLISASRPLRTVHYSGMVVWGFLAGVLTVGPAFPQAFANPFDYLFPLLAVMAVAAAFQSAVLLNDLFDREIDVYTGKPNPAAAEQMSGPEIIRWAVIYGAWSLLYVWVLNQAAVLIIIFTLAISFIYSAPPLRLRRYYPLSVMLIALASLASAWLGFSAFGGARTLELFPARLGWFILACFSLSFATKDLNDVAGDMKAGVITLPTLLGEKTGKIVTAFLVIIAYAIGPLILGLPWLLAAALPAGLITVWLVLKPRVREGLVFIVYFVYGAVAAMALWHNPQTIRNQAAELQGTGLSGWEYFFQKRYAQAAPLLNRNYLFTQDPALLWPLARSLYETKDLVSAREFAALLLRRYPVYDKAHHLAARIELASGAVEPALSHYRRAIAMGISAADFHRQAGDLLLKSDRLDMAERHYRQALAAGGEEREIIAKLARVRMAKGDTAWAECRLRNILKEEPGNLIVLLVQGDIALWRGNLQEACSIFSRMVKTAPGRPELRYKLGLSLEGLGKWTEAAQEYQRIVKQEPDYWPAWLGLSRCYLLSGDPEASRQALERATSTSDRITDEEDETP